jgi:DNA polymerase I-like protein with 3'-5' exonuclease and polymerase domains
LHRCEELEAELHNLIVGTLDPIFIPIVGNKKETITDEMIEKATSEWKAFTEVSGEELAYIKNERAAKKLGDSEEAERFTKLTDKARLDRLAEKERLKIEARKLSYLQTTQRNLTAECEGDALINYGSDKQLVAVIKKMPGLASVNDMQDGTLEKYKNKPVMAAIKEYHRLSKEISTYGRAWATVWKTHPCNEEGWLNPGDGRLHSTFNQLEAETGRSSSEKPNGQNVPRDKDIRSCFIADEPNPDEMVLITIDMSGAELRIIAECANDPLWIGAFARNEDVHSVGTELLYPEEWISGALPNCAYYKLHTEESVEKNPLCKIGEPQRQKCECPKHKTMRSDNKDCNFLIAYGGSSYALAARIGKKAREAALLMALHEQKNPLIWSYLNKSGIDAKRRKKSFDMFGRRRLFPEPTRELARERFIDDFSEKLLRPLYTKKDQTGATIEGSIEMQERFENQFHRKPTPKERWHLTHVSPTEKQITSTMIRMCDEISRQGKNHCIQGTNVSIAKLALGSSQDENGNPYLWTTLPKYGAKMVKFVHDELVISCPKKYSEIVANLVVDAFRRAAFKKMKNVVMESDYVISDHWEK